MGRILVCSLWVHQSAITFDKSGGVLLEQGGDGYSQAGQPADQRQGRRRAHRLLQVKAKEILDIKIII